MSYSNGKISRVNGHSEKHAESYQDPVQEFVRRLKAGGWEPRPISNEMWESLCPAHAILGEHYKKNLQVKTGEDGRCLVHCFARNCKIEDIVRAVGMEVFQLFPAKDKGVNHVTNGSVDTRPRFESPREASERFVRDFGEPTVYKYDSSFWILRFTTGNGKDIKPVSRNERGWAVCDPAKSNLPLYNLKTLKELPDGATVWVVEGEKCVDIMSRLGIPATTSCHGSGAAKKSDWSPLARFRVILNPDNDSPGEDYARAVAGILGALPKPPEIRYVRFSNLPSAGDIEQHLENCAGFDDVAIREDLERLASEADLLPRTPKIEAVTLADIKVLMGDTSRFLSNQFMIRHHVNILYAKEKVGKTHVALDICRRIYHGLEWPNGEPPTFPVGTRTLWVCGDRHQDEVLERGEMMGIPLDAIILNSTKGDEYGSLDLDDSGNRERLDMLCTESIPV